MSERYEHVNADAAEPRIVGPGTVIGGDVISGHALILGDPWASAFVIEGDPNAIAEMLRRALAQVGRDVPCGTCGHPLYVDYEGDHLHADPADVWGGDHLPEPLRPEPVMATVYSCCTDEPRVEASHNVQVTIKRRVADGGGPAVHVTR